MDWSIALAIQLQLVKGEVLYFIPSIIRMVHTRVKNKRRNEVMHKQEKNDRKKSPKNEVKGQSSSQGPLFNYRFPEWIAPLQY